MKPEPDVLIAGAGPTGLALACGLLANGVAARLVDKAVEPAGTSRALGLQPRGIEVVERLGALNGLPERALQVEQIVVHISGRHAASVRVGQRTALVTRLVGCDGAHSRVRQLAGVGFPGVPFAERFLLVDAHADLPLSRHSIYSWLDADTVFGAFPLPGRDVWRLMVPTADPAVVRHGRAG